MKHLQHCIFFVSHFLCKSSINSSDSICEWQAAWQTSSSTRHLLPCDFKLTNFRVPCFINVLIISATEQLSVQPKHVKKNRRITDEEHCQALNSWWQAVRQLPSFGVLLLRSILAMRHSPPFWPFIQKRTQGFCFFYMFGVKWTECVRISLHSTLSHLGTGNRKSRGKFLQSACEDDLRSSEGNDEFICTCTGLISIE